jgi:hypothetical protein
MIGRPPVLGKEVLYAKGRKHHHNPIYGAYLFKFQDFLMYGCMDLQGFATWDVIYYSFGGASMALVNRKRGIYVRKAAIGSDSVSRILVQVVVTDPWFKFSR